MLHIATVHYNDARWIDIQLEQLDRHLSVPYTTWASLEGIDHAHYSKFDVPFGLQGPHAGKLNFLAAVICEKADPGDLLMFLDGDAFPIADPVPMCRRAVVSSSLIAVQRVENYGDVQPHPCFAVTNVATWNDLNGDWSPGYTWKNRLGLDVTDVGGNLLGALERGGHAWHALRRTNRRDLHPVWFAVYGDVIYHHGSGFRRPVSRLDLRAADALAVPWTHAEGLRKVVYRLWRRALRAVSGRRGKRLSSYVYEKIRADSYSVWELLC